MKRKTSTRKQVKKKMSKTRRQKVFSKESAAQNTGHTLPLFESVYNFSLFLSLTKVHIEKEVVAGLFVFCFVFFESGELACCVAVLFPGFWFVSFFSFLFSSLFFLLSSFFSLLSSLVKCWSFSKGLFFFFFFFLLLSKGQGTKNDEECQFFFFFLFSFFFFLFSFFFFLFSFFSFLFSLFLFSLSLSFTSLV